MYRYFKNSKFIRSQTSVHENVKTLVVAHYGSVSWYRTCAISYGVLQTFLLKLHYRYLGLHFGLTIRGRQGGGDAEHAM